ncbi:hypothetical protein PFISCL1PPCAC_14070, partial [Pristionchus fissidentatus]
MLMRVSSVLLLSLDNLVRHGFSVVDQPTSSHDIEHASSPIGHVRELGRTVILGESVVEVVSALSCCLDIRPDGFDGRDGRIVRLVPEHVSGGVDQECGVECEDVSEHAGDVEGDERRLSPEVDGDESGKNEADECGKGKIVPSLECKNGVVVEVGDVDLRSHFLQFLTLSRQQPSDVRVEESPLGVVRVGLGVCPFVMTTMVSRPLDHVVLMRECAESHEEESSRKCGLEGAMRPVAMSARSDSHGTSKVEDDGEEEGGPAADEEELIGANEGGDVSRGEGEDVTPDNLEGRTRLQSLFFQRRHRVEVGREEHFLALNCRDFGRSAHGGFCR